MSMGCLEERAVTDCFVTSNGVGLKGDLWEVRSHFSVEKKDNLCKGLLAAG